MTETPTIIASLVLRNFGDDPQIVTRVLGREPTRSGRQGEHLISSLGRATARVIRQTYWSLHSRTAKSAPLAQHVADIVEQLRASSALFNQLPNGTTITLRCTVIPDGGLPLLSVESESLRCLGEIGAALEIDVISIEGRESEPSPAGEA